MKKQTHILIIIFFINFFIFILLINQLFATAEEFRMIKELEEMERGKAEPEVIERPQIEYKAQDLRDPFEGHIKKEEIIQRVRPEEAAPETPPEFRVQGIVWGDVSPCAIVNNKVVKVGDIIEGAEIIKIKKEGITILYRGRIYEGQVSEEVKHED